MNFEQVNWWDKVADWGWAMLVAGAAGVLYIVRRDHRHDARIDALEKAQAALEKRHGDSLEEIKSLERKLDEKHDKVFDAINALRTEISEERRFVTAELLARVPRA